MLHIMNNRT